MVAVAPVDEFDDEDQRYGEGDLSEAHLGVPTRGMASWIDDLWSRTNPTTPGYTWDRTTNPLARGRNGPRRRLDYVLAPLRLARGATMSVVCAQRIAGPVFASDHFGLLAQLPELRE